MSTQPEQKAPSRLVVSFRGEKVELPLVAGVTVLDVKIEVSSRTDPSLHLEPSHVKLLYKGKVLLDNDQDMYELLVGGTKKKSVYRIMAMGVSAEEAQATNQKFEEGLRNASRVRDDLTEGGRREMARRQQLGRKMMQKVANRGKVSEKFGFGKIETLPMLPDQAKAREILTTLANDPGVLACLAKHKWNIGSLAEMYPEGKVGESAVCVMGLNKNKGQQILLRIRTDDLKGFRKMLSIRKVLFHELAHNVHSEHDQNFFQLMRQIERECNEMNWTMGSGNTTGGVSSAYSSGTNEFGDIRAFSGGTYRLGGSESSKRNVPVRELAARAAMLRMTEEEEEIQRLCGCGRDVALHTPENDSSEIQNQVVTTADDMQDDEDGTEN